MGSLMVNVLPLILLTVNKEDASAGKKEFASNAQKDGISLLKEFVLQLMIFAILGNKTEIAILVIKVILYNKENV